MATPPLIERLSCSAHGVIVDVGGRTLELSWRWLRDHARDDASYHRAAHQRIVPSAVVAGAGAGAASVSEDRRALIVSWRDGPTTSFAGAVLSTLGEPAEMYAALGPLPQPWAGPELGGRLTRLGYAEFVGTAGGLREALDGLSRDGVMVVHGVPTDTAATRRALQRFGSLRTTIFGELWEFSSDGALADTASTSLEISPHTDGTYSHDAPGLLGLHCHVYDATGGANVVVDGHTIAARLAHSSPEHLRLLRETEIAGQYIGDGAHLVARRPALRHEGDRLAQVSYNHHDRAPFLLPEPAMSELYDALRHFDALANDADLQFELTLQPGDMVVFDNWRVLHGRRAFSGERRIAGAYISREDVDSTRRLLAASP